MAILYPTALDNFTNPSGSQALGASTPAHSGQHGDANDAVEALEAKVGIGASTPIANSVLAGTSAGVSGWTTTPRIDRLGVGAAANASVAVIVRGAGLTSGVNQYGVLSDFTSSSAATSSQRAFNGQIITSAAAYTVTNAYTYRAETPSLGAASAITAQFGFYAANQGASGVTNAYGVYIEAQSGAATLNIGLNNLGTTTFAPSLSSYGGSGTRLFDLNGSFTGTGNDIAAFRIGTSLAPSGAITSAYGFRLEPSFAPSSGATTSAMALRVAPGTGSGGGSITNLYGIKLDANYGSNKPTTVYGIHVTNYGSASITNAYGVYVEAQSGAGTTNIGIYNLGTTRLDGAVGIGTAPISNVYLDFRAAPSGATTGYGMRVLSSATSGVTSEHVAVLVDPRTAAAAFTVSSSVGVRVQNPTKGGGSTITTASGIYIESHTAGATNNYGIYVDAPSGGSNANRGVYIAGGGLEVYGTSGVIGVGVAPQSQAAIYIQKTIDSGGARYGIFSDPTTNASASVVGVYARPNTSAAAITAGTATGFIAANAVKGAGSTITTARGVYVEAQTQGDTNNYGIYVEAPSGGSSDNVGIYVAGGTQAGIKSGGTFVLTNAIGSLASTADEVRLGAYDLSAGNATLSLSTETAVVSEAVVSDRTLQVRINGTTYKICLKA